MSCRIVGLIVELIASISCLYLSIFLSFQAKFVSKFSQKECKLQSSTRHTSGERVVVFWGWDSGSLVFSYHCFLHFSFFPSFWCWHWKNVSRFSQKLLKLESWNLVYIWTMTYCVLGLRVGLIALILPFVLPFSVISEYISVTVLLRTVQVTIFKHSIHNEVWVIVPWDRDSGSVPLFFNFSLFFFLSLFCMSALKLVSPSS